MFCKLLLNARNDSYMLFYDPAKGQCQMYNNPQNLLDGSKKIPVLRRAFNIVISGCNHIYTTYVHKTELP